MGKNFVSKTHVMSFSGVRYHYVYYIRPYVYYIRIHDTRQWHYIRFWHKPHAHVFFFPLVSLVFFASWTKDIIAKWRFVEFFQLNGNLLCKKFIYSLSYIEWALLEIYKNPLIYSQIELFLTHFFEIFDQVGRVFANGPGDLGLIPGRIIPKTLKMVLDTSLLNTQHYKVAQSTERSSALS